MNPGSRDALLQSVRREPGITIAEVLRREPLVTVDDIYFAVAGESVGADRRTTLLTDHENFRLWPDQEMADLMSTPAPVARGELDLSKGAQLQWGGIAYEVINATNDFVYLQSAEGSTRISAADAATWAASGDITAIADGRASINQFLLDAKPEYLDIARDRLKAIQPYLDGRLCTDRTHQRWVAAYKQAEILFGNGFPGLVPGFTRSGDRVTERFSPATRALGDRVIAEQLLTPELRKGRKAYGIYRELAEQEDLKAVARSTFMGWYNAISSAAKAGAQWGHRAASAAAMRTPISGWPVRGDRPLERVFIDHSPSDVPVRDRVTGADLGIPWLSVAVDGYSRRVLAWTLLFDAPSARTVQLLLRQIAQKHGRWGDTLVLDGGPEFRSDYVERLTASRGVHIEHHGAGKARFSGQVEAFFKQIQADLFHNMRANNKIRRNVRKMSGTHDPSRRAVWTYPAVAEEVERYIELYDNQPIRTLGGSPKQLFDRGIAQSGTRSHMRIIFDLAFRALTAFPGPRKGGTAKVGNQGVKIRNLTYWCEAFRQPGVEGTYVKVRYEPLDARIGYALVNGVWYECLADYPELHGRTEAEIRNAGIELRRRLGQDPSMAELSRFLLEMQAREAALAADKQQLIDAQRAAAQRALLAPVTPAQPAGPDDALAPSDFDGEITSVPTYEAPEPQQRPAPAAERPAA